jgi:group II intron reverse transcriptase/maturase/CRISPR-associated endonuclease Cas1
MPPDVRYEQILDPALLKSAWLDVKSKATMGGIDGQDVASFDMDSEKYLGEILADLKNESFKPYPYQKISIPKSDGTLRILGLLTIKDKIMQGALKQLIEPVFEPQFLDISYAYRATKGHVKAVKRIVHILKSTKPTWVISCDIKNFFDTVDHTILQNNLAESIHDPKLLNLMKLTYIMGRVDKKGSWIESKIGIPQGGILSPLFANVYLHHFDTAINSSQSQLVRYADDFVILCPSKEKADEAFVEIKRIIEQELKLTIKPDYTISEIKKGFTFLGISFDVNGIRIAAKKLESMAQSLSNLPVLDNGQLHKKLIEKLKGYQAYYGKLLSEEELEKIDLVVFKAVSERLLTAFKSKTLNKTEIKKLLSNVGFLSVSFTKSRSTFILSELRNEHRQIEKKKKPNRKIPLEVLQRKREYQQLQSQGMDLVIIKPGCFVSKTQQKVTVKYMGKILTEVSSTNLRSISITSSGITITSNLIEHCMEQSIAIDFFDFRGNPYAKIFSPDLYSIQNGLAQLDAFKNRKADTFCKTLIQSKIYNQTAYIKYHSKYRKNLSKEWKLLLNDTIVKMDVISLSIDKLEYENLEELRGKLLSAEGRAAACYWSIIGALVKPKIPSFDGRERKGASDLFNSMLNYGYSILYARLWSCLIRSGLNPGISYLHVEQKNKPTLVYDLIEQFRVQAVEKPLVAMAIKEDKLKIDKTGWLTEETKKRVVQKILERINTFEVFRDKEMRLIDIFQRQTDDFQKYLSGEIKTYKPYLMKW